MCNKWKLIQNLDIKKVFYQKNNLEKKKKRKKTISNSGRVYTLGEMYISSLVKMYDFPSPYPYVEHTRNKMIRICIKWVF